MHKLIAPLLLMAVLLWAPEAHAQSSVWDSLAYCESRGQWQIDTGNGYRGGLQMDQTFWINHGGLAYAEYPDWATRSQQIQVAINGRDGLVGYAQGYYAWPTCARILGLI
jgi:transglycosylase-like protein